MIESKRWLSLLTLLLSLSLAACSLTQGPQAPATARPVIVVRPDHLNFIVEAGIAYNYEQTIAIANATGGPLDWYMSDNALWIILESGPAAENATSNAARVKLDTSGMTAGLYSGYITIASDAALNSPVHVPVSLEIKPAVIPGQASPPAPATEKATPALNIAPPAPSRVVWQNRVVFEKYSLVNACIATGSISNTDNLLYLKDVQIVSKSGRSVSIAQVIPAGETVMYRRFIPCYQFEELSLKYNWGKP